MTRKMKDSGVEWIGMIPDGWNVGRLGAVLADRNESNNPVKTDVILSLTNDRGVILYADKGNQGNKSKDDITQYKLAYPNDIVLNSMNVVIGSVGLSPYFGAVSPVYYMLYPRNDKTTSIRFFDYIFQTTAFQQSLRGYGNGIMEIRMRIQMQKLKTVMLAYPSKEEQERIVRILDAKCAAIDDVIAKTNESIEEYKKLKQAVITEAVTKGVRGKRPMKDSGSVWFGKIPSDWNMVKFKHIIHIRKDIAGTEGYTVLSITQRGIIPKDLSKNEGQLASDYSNYQLVDVGDFAMNHMDLLTGWVDISKYNGVTSPDYRVFALNDSKVSCAKYYLYLVQMCYIDRIFYSLGQGVSGFGRWRLPADQFLNFMVAVPSYNEQKEIAECIERKCAAIDTLISKKQQFIDELTAYKKSLIYEYVTGKKEVPA